MKTTSMNRLIAFVCGAVIALGTGGIQSVGAAAADGAASGSLLKYPKNMARLHLGATIMAYDAKAGTYGATAAAGAWLDDDAVTGWTPPAGKQYFLLALAEPALMSNFLVSAGGSIGKVSLYAGDEKAIPGDAKWIPVLQNIDVQQINEKVTAGTLNRYGRFLLIETDLEKSTPWYSVYVYGRDPGIAYRLEPRLQQVDTGAILGPDIKQTTVFDLANLYSGARVLYANTGGSLTDWQAMIDDSPETAWSGAGTTGGNPTLVVDLGAERKVRRISTLATAKPGVLEIFMLENLNGPAGAPQPAASAGAVGPEVVNLDRSAPVATIGFDGASDREAIDFAPATGRYLVARWKPSTPGEAIQIRQLGAFGDLNFDKYAVVSSPEVIAESEGKEALGDKVVMNDGKEFKSLLDPIAEGPLDPGTPQVFRVPLLPPSGIPPLLIVTP